MTVVNHNMSELSETAAKRKLNVIVVGGSLGGLCTGVALKQLGHDVTILERNPDKLLHNQGAGIVAGGDTLEFFKRYDRCQRSFAVSSQKRMYLNKQGKTVHTEDMVRQWVCSSVMCST